MAALVKHKEGKNFIVYKSGEDYLIKIENVRFSYPHFGARQEQENESGTKELSWGGVAMLPKETHEEAKAQFDKILTHLLKKNGTTTNGVTVPAKVEPQNRCVKDGDDKEDPNMGGHWLITFKEKDASRRPGVRTAQGGVMTDEAKIDEMFFGGVYGSVLLRPWYFNGKSKKANKTYPKRLCCGFTGVQFLRTGEAFGQGRIDDTEAWGGATEGDGMDDDDEL